VFAALYRLFRNFHNCGGDGGFLIFIQIQKSSTVAASKT
jgi:hypothetical protein